MEWQILGSPTSQCTFKRKKKVHITTNRLYFLPPFLPSNRTLFSNAFISQHSSTGTDFMVVILASRNTNLLWSAVWKCTPSPTGCHNTKRVSLFPSPNVGTKRTTLPQQHRGINDTKPSPKLSITPIARDLPYRLRSGNLFHAQHKLLTVNCTRLNVHSLNGKPPFHS